MVRENKKLEKAIGGLDQDQGTRLDDELRAAGKAQHDTVDPEHTMTRHPITIRGDAAPDKKGKR
jgi:hypothetical protein